MSSVLGWTRPLCNPPLGPARCSEPHPAFLLSGEQPAGVVAVPEEDEERETSPAHETGLATPCETKPPIAQAAVLAALQAAEVDRRLRNPEAFEQTRRSAFID